ncbi:MAG: hypothetical protein IJE14_11020 [Clostridia bacterium]|nr:hypothetical protein [Clostridia bacterium]
MSNICMIAHRGYSSKYPDNTAVAFKKAAENRSGGAETDVRLTKDVVLVTNHNEEATFFDGTEMLVSEHTFEELTAKPLLNEKSDDVVYLCTFKEYLEIMKENGMVCFIELKGSYTDEQVKAVFDLAAEVYDLSKCILQSFDFDNLIKAREMFPDLPLMFTYGTAQNNYERCFDYGIAIDADRVVITQEMVDEFHAHGLEVGVWTVNTADELARISALGVDYIESDVFGG